MNTLKIKPEQYQKLVELKDKHDLKNMTNTIEHLLNRDSNKMDEIQESHGKLRTTQQEILDKCKEIKDILSRPINYETALPDFRKMEFK